MLGHHYGDGIGGRDLVSEADRFRRTPALEVHVVHRQVVDARAADLEGIGQQARHRLGEFAG